MTITGKIFKGIGGFYYVRGTDGNVYECRARGKFRKERITPMIGDNVIIETEGETGSVSEILPRSSSMIRPAVANIDMLVVVAAAACPEPNAFLIDKMLVNAEIAGIKPTVCFNKCDVVYPEEMIEVYRKAGYDTIAVSARTRAGMRELTEMIRSKTAAFAGVSGVGKSSILRCITGSDLEVGAVSEKISRGRHTTRHVELFSAADGYVLDTPGFSDVEPTPTDARALAEFFPEMRDCIGLCRFRGCAHINEPDCAVKEKAERGDIAPSRYESYRELYELQRSRKLWK